MLDPQPNAPSKLPPGLPTSAPGVSAAEEAQAIAAVRDLLDRARKRQRTLLRLTAGLLVVTGLLLLAPALFGLAASGFAAARPLALVALVAAALVYGWQGVWRVRREVGDPSATARLLATRLDSPELRRGLLPAFELSRELAQPHVDFSRALARAHIGQVAQHARRASLESALPDRPVRLAGRVFFFAALLFLVAIALFRGPMSRGARLVAFGQEAPATKAATSAEPVTGDVELTYVYPAHTRLPSRTLPNTNGEISAPKGTQVRLKTRADREVEKAFALVGNTALPLEVQHGRDLSGTLVVESAGSYRFRLVGARGKVLAEGPPIPIAIEEDLRPKATIVAPMADIEVDPKSRVELRYDAEDDFGVSELALLFKLPGASKAERVILQRSKDAPRRASGKYDWDLVAPSLSPGDTIAYYLEATDNDEVSGKKTGVSRTQYLKIFSEAEHHRKLVQKIEASWEKLVTLLADRLESAERKPDGRTPEKILGGATLDSRALALAAELSDLSVSLRKEKSPDQLWRALALVSAGLKEKATATFDARTGAANWLRRGAAVDSDPVRRVSRALEAEIAEEEKDVLYLEALVDQQRIADLAALSKELVSKRRELADLLEKYRAAPDEAARDRLIKEIARLKERMGELMKRMAELLQVHQRRALQRRGAPGDGRVAADDGRLRQAPGAAPPGQGRGRDEGDGEAGPDARQARAEPEQGQQGEPGRAVRPLGQGRRAVRQGPRHAPGGSTAAARRHAEGPGALQAAPAGPAGPEGRRLRREAAQEGRRGAQEARGDQEPAGLLARGRAQARQGADRRPRQGARGEGLRPGRGVRRQGADVRRAGLRRLRARSPGRSPLPAGLPGGGVAGAEERPQRQERRPAAPGHQARARQPPAAARRGDERAGPPGDEGHGPAPGPAAAEGWPTAPEDGRPEPAGAPLPAGGAGHAAAGGRAHAARSDQDAGARSDRLGRGGARRARSARRQLEKGLQKQQGGQSQGGGQPLPWPWKGPGQEPNFGNDDGEGRQNDEKVEIPNADQYTVPEEYRKDILDAMKQGAPEKYKDQVKRYYEEIVK
ncbi:MAG: hypothetical protein QM765_47265 [Myxococcales bacterium]